MKALTDEQKQAFAKFAVAALEISNSGAVNPKPLLTALTNSYDLAVSVVGNDTTQPEFSPYRLILAYIVSLTKIEDNYYFDMGKDKQWCHAAIISADAAKL